MCVRRAKFFQIADAGTVWALKGTHHTPLLWMQPVRASDLDAPVKWKVDTTKV